MSRPAPPHRPELRREFPSNLAEVDPTCHQIRAFLREHGEARAGFVLELVARECINNAMLHGNKQDPHKHVTLGLRIGRRHFCLRVEDEGAGFPWRAILGRPIPDETAVRGRGLPILDMYTKQVRFNDSGNRVTVWLARAHTEG